MTDPVLLDLQRQLEFESVDRGIKRYQDYRQKNAGNGRPEQKLAGLALDAVTVQIQIRRDQIQDGEVIAARGLQSWGPVVMYFPSEMLSACALVTMIHVLVSRFAKHKPTVRQDIIRAIGENVETMFHLLKAKEMDKDLFNVLSKRMKNWDGRRARRFYRKVTGLDRAWSLADRCHIGGLLYSLVMGSTGWFEERHTVKGVQVHIIPAVLGELEKAHEQMELLAPFDYPMVIPPADWGPGKRGGYIYQNYDLFKPVNPGDRPPNLNDAPAVYKAVNALQATGFCIDKKVWAVQDAVWKAGGGWAGVPLRNPIISKLTGPRAPEGSGDAEIMAAKKLRASLWDDEAQEISPRLAMLYRKSVVERMLPFDAFYFMYQMDWRGRLYPKATALNPQGDDLDKGLLRFSESVAQTEEGTRWLHIHAANCWANDGLDKEPYDDRVAWVERHRSSIERTVADPLGFKWWAQAENPWQFLAACYELTRTDGLTSLPVAVDGTCNGLQHYSAIGLDPIGGAAVNLIPSKRPSSIYSLVAVEAKKRLLDYQVRGWWEYTGKGGERIRCPLPAVPPITKNLVKRPVMTLPYGLTPIGMRDQLLTDPSVKALPDPQLSALFLRDLIWESVGKVVVKAMEYMQWLKGAAGMANKQGIALQWTAPTGMVVTQDYVVPDESRLNLPGIGKTVFRIIPETLRKLNKTKQSNGTCPNYIHTFDAAHLQLTVCACWDHGIRSFHMIHDGYGTHAPHVPVLNRILREQFILIYKDNPLEEFKSVTEARLGAALDPLPVRGSLNINLVKESTYFFG